MFCYAGMYLHEKEDDMQVKQLRRNYWIITNLT